MRWENGHEGQRCPRMLRGQSIEVLLCSPRLRLITTGHLPSDVLLTALAKPWRLSPVEQRGEFYRFTTGIRTRPGILT